MEIAKQIKKRRLDLNLSQEELAEKIYVTRQTISNWENDKNYPDIKSLLLLSEIFSVSLDILVKGDLEEMRETINSEDIKKFKHASNIFVTLLAVSIVSAVPLTHFFKIPGIIAWILIYAVTMVYAFRIERLKKTHNVNTYREILTFLEGKELDEVEKANESKKYFSQNVVLILGTALIAAIVCGLFLMILK